MRRYRDFLFLAKVVDCNKIKKKGFGIGKYGKNEYY